MPRFLLAAILIAFSIPAIAQTVPDYMDDRSTATSLVKSFYNAINRQEYLRAWSYYRDAGEESGQTLEDFKAGFAETRSVELLTGAEVSEGAAGSIYFTVPAAIDAETNSGGHRQFAGCYTLRLTQPANQEERPFRPLQIEKGALKPAEGKLDAILPKSCEP